MKQIDNFIIEKLKINKDSKVKGDTVNIVDRIFHYSTVDDKKIIDYILEDFVGKCIELIERNPGMKFNSTKTYVFFENTFGKKDEELPQVPGNKFKIIYNGVPNGSTCKKIFSRFNYKKITFDEFICMFGSGEFPLITIHTMPTGFGSNKYTYYTISR